MKVKPVKNVNYCATTAKVINTIALDNCDNVQAAIVLGSQIIVGKDTNIGDVGVFFPIECKLSDTFLSSNNLYRHSEKNKDTEKKGYFEDSGRLRAVKFRGHKSEGLFMPMSCLDFIRNGLDLGPGQDFDELEGIPICEKYVIVRKSPTGNRQGKKALKRISRLVENQFRLHRDTAQLKKYVHFIKPDDIISITSKLHGTSAVFGNVLVKRKLPIRDKIARLFGVKVIETEYDLVYSSRNVVKNENFFVRPQYSFYDTNVWEEWSNKLHEFIPKGMSIYAEIVGYLSSGGAIQKGYHYGCDDSKSELYIYRITQTNVDGVVTELTRPEIDEFCTRNKLKATPLLYYGKAGELYPFLLHRDDWNGKFLEELIDDIGFGMGDTMCKMNNSEVPSEGIVLRVEGIYSPTPYKLKNYAFLERETKLLDAGEEDIEEAN